MSKPDIVIVPGAWHRPQHYQRINDRLANLGYAATGVSLPSVDSRPPLASWDQDAEKIRQVILKIANSGKDVIVVGHSFGGVSMSEAAKGLGKTAREEQGLKGGVVKLIYMCAMALPEGQSYLSQMQPQTLEEDEKRWRPENGGVFFEEDGTMVVNKDISRDFLYSGCDPKDADEALDLLGTNPVGPFGVPASYTAYFEIPSTYIVCENDRIIPLAFQKRIIAQGGGVFDIERCKEGHSPFLSNPGFIVDCICRSVARRT